jgi:nucleotide-binding universal stress UspA family protein
MTIVNKDHTYLCYTSTVNMDSTILVPIDDSVMATKALEFAIDAHPLADITALHVVGGLTPFM